MSGPDLVVTVDVAVRSDRTTARLRACHCLQGDRVETVLSSEDDLVQGTVDVSGWRGELARVCRVVVPGDAPTPPADGPDLPWDMVVGTGAALTEHRPDLQAELLARVDAPVRAQVGRLHHATVGRLRAVGVLPSRRRMGWVSWVLFADGWRALTPYVAGGTPMVRLERRQPDDLAVDVARWASATVR